MRHYGTFIPFLIVVLAATACSDQARVSELREPGDPTASNGAGLPNVPADGVRSLGVGTLCVTGKPVLVTSVTPISPQGGLTIAGWGVRPSLFGTGRDGFGEFDGPIPAKEGFAADDTARVTGHCPATPDTDATERLSEIAVALRRGTASSSSTSALRVTYSVDGTTASMTMNYSVTLCSSEVTAKGCR